jgi:5-methylcytosine-specific restriction endonuclease McrA
VDWNTYIVRLFVTKDQLQVLCKPCHKEKTNLENTARRKAA